MEIKVFVDTNILIDYSKGYQDSLRELFIKQHNRQIQLCINSIIMMEYLSGIVPRFKKKALSFLKQFDFVPMGFGVGIHASELVRSKDISFWKDALIAASCLDENAMIATKNKKHFKDIKNLKIYEI